VKNEIFFFPQDRDCIKQLSTSRKALLDLQAHQSTKCNYICSLYVSQCRHQDQYAHQLAIAAINNNIML